MKSKSGKLFNGFTPAVSNSAKQKFRDKMRELREKGKMMTLEELARIMNPAIRGWMNYFSKYNPSEAIHVLNFVNHLLTRWAWRRYNRLRGRLDKTLRWLVQVVRNNPNLFYHWQLGICPTMMMTRAG